MDTKRRKLLCWGAAGMAALMAGARAAAADAPRIQVTARKFQFTPNPIVIPRGVDVILEITAVDFMHGFSVPELKFRTDLMPGRVTRIPLRINHAGPVDFLCDNFCGDGHEEMNGRILVTA
ncbi:cytochrome c oxidase subunit II [Pseudoduganella eburnea]|uniref:Nitrous-oxide reductase n=1 Tax=Massilia eburnea TaxID=1776165 RepID=A0A6L6QBE8_9BURK|nr:cupredoxin domain-containing protein [Massilia eburnea]MTW09117.1 cytochrome c oxidase subunit II [Massilia eburnea]